MKKNLKKSVIPPTTLQLSRHPCKRRCNIPDAEGALYRRRICWNPASLRFPFRPRRLRSDGSLYLASALL